MAEAIEIGTVSARGQVAIPTLIREKMHMQEGERILFFLEGDSLLIKKVENLSWEQITQPLRMAKKRIKEEDLSELIHRMRKKV